MKTHFLKRVLYVVTYILSAVCSLLINVRPGRKAQEISVHKCRNADAASMRLNTTVNSHLPTSKHFYTLVALVVYYTRYTVRKVSADFDVCD